MLSARPFPQAARPAVLMPMPCGRHRPGPGTVEAEQQRGLPWPEPGVPAGFPKSPWVCLDVLANFQPTGW